MTGGAGLLFPGPAGLVASAAVRAALAAGVNANAALLFGRICSFNGKPFWELRVNLGALLGCSKRTITRYFAELVDAALIVNRPAPIGEIPAGCRGKLPYRPWYKWAIGLPALREAVRSGAKDAYERWRAKFEVSRQERATRTKLGEIIGTIVSTKSVVPPTRSTQSTVSAPTPRRWTADELDAAMAASGEPPVPPSRPPDTS